MPSGAATAAGATSVQAVDVDRMRDPGSAELASGGGGWPGSSRGDLRVDRMCGDQSGSAHQAACIKGSASWRANRRRGLTAHGLADRGPRAGASTRPRESALGLPAHYGRGPPARPPSLPRLGSQSLRRSGIPPSRLRSRPTWIAPPNWATAVTAQPASFAQGSRLTLASLDLRALMRAGRRPRTTAQRA